MGGSRYRRGLEGESIEVGGVGGAKIGGSQSGMELDWEETRMGGSRTGGELGGWKRREPAWEGTGVVRGVGGVGFGESLSFLTLLLH